jgi:predicted DNA-binding transcriptional regulator AlpA
VSRRSGFEDRRELAQAALAAQKDLPTEPISVRIATAVKLTGISRSVLYELIAEGAIETRKIGQSTLILYRSLKRLIEG